MVTSSPAGCRGSEAVTRSVRVAVTPQYLPDHSDADARRYVFAYRIRITNESPRAVRLESRHWIIVDAHGRTEEVRGDGVIGRQPEIQPGESFEYASYCPLPTKWGTMEGSYLFRPVEGDGEPFQVAVARFYLVTPERI